MGGKELTAADDDRVGFLIKRSETDSTAFINEESTEKKDCRLSELEGIVIPINTTSAGYAYIDTYRILPPFLREALFLF